jgi:hypothetical protein
MDAVLAQAVADAAGRQHRSPGLTVVMYNRQQNCQIYRNQSPAAFAGLAKSAYPLSWTG